MADITVDEITNPTNTGVFDKLMAAVNSHIETQYNTNRITGEDYANVYLGSIQAVLQQAVQFALQEELTEAQIEGIAADNLIKNKELGIADKRLQIADKELDLKAAEANRLKDMTQAELEKQWGYEVTRDANNELVLGVDDGGGKIDKEVIKLQSDIDLGGQQLEIAKSQTALEKAKAIASIDKEYGFNYSLDADQNIVVGTDANDGRIDAEVTKMQADAEISKAALAVERAKAQASIRKEYGFAYNLDGDLNIIIGDDQGDGKLDKELEALDAQIAETRASSLRSDQQLNETLLATAKEREINEYRLNNILPAEFSVISQKIVGKKQSAVIEE